MVYFIDIEKLKSESLIHGNVEAGVLSVILKRSQDISLSDALGNRFYKHLSDAIQNSSETLKEVELREDYIENYLTIATEIMACVQLNWEIRNKSVGTANDEYATASNWDSIDKLKADLHRQRQYYKVLMLEFIIENKSSFPLFNQNCDSPDVGGNSYDSTISFLTNRR